MYERVWIDREEAKKMFPDKNDQWISWSDHPVPEDVRGILIKYDDGVFSDRYDHETGKRKYREGKMIIGWKFMERADPNRKTVHAIL